MIMTISKPFLFYSFLLTLCWAIHYCLSLAKVFDLCDLTGHTYLMCPVVYCLTSIPKFSIYKSSLWLRGCQLWTLQQMPLVQYCDAHHFTQFNDMRVLFL